MGPISDYEIEGWAHWGFLEKISFFFFFRGQKHQDIQSCSDFVCCPSSCNMKGLPEAEGNSEDGRHRGWDHRDPSDTARESCLGPYCFSFELALLFKPVGFVLKLAAKSLLINRVPIISYKDPAIWWLSPLFLQNTKSKPFIPTVTKLKMQRNWNWPPPHHHRSRPLPSGAPGFWAIAALCSWLRQ